MMTKFADALSRFRSSTEEPRIYAIILQGIIGNLPAGDQQAILKCDADAERLHRGQLRNDGAPYIVHPRRVAILAATYSGAQLEASDVMAALAHDLIEDCGVTEEWVCKNYGSKVSTTVSLLSAPSKAGESNRQRRDRKAAKYAALANVDRSVLRLHAMDVLDNTISWRFIEPNAEGFRKIPRWMWQVVQYQIPLLSDHFGDIAEELAREVDYQRLRGFEIGSWDSP